MVPEQLSNGGGENVGHSPAESGTDFCEPPAPLAKPLNSLRPSDAYICVGNLTIIGSDNGLSPGRRQAITWTNVGILLIGHLGTNFSGMLIEIHSFSFKKIHLKMSSGKWRPFCLGLNVSNQHYSRKKGWHYGRETHICVSIYVSVVSWERGLILTGPLGKYLSDQSNFHSRKSIENVATTTTTTIAITITMIVIIITRMCCQ